MNQVTEKSAVKQAFEKVLRSYPQIPHETLYKIFAAAVEAKADDDQVIIYKAEMRARRKAA